MSIGMYALLRRVLRGVRKTRTVIDWRVYWGAMLVRVAIAWDWLSSEVQLLRRRGES